VTAAPALGKDLVGLEELSADQLRLILDTAEPFKEVSELDGRDAVVIARRDDPEPAR
jgi:hypothetical protein